MKSEKEILIEKKNYDSRNIEKSIPQTQEESENIMLKIRKEILEEVLKNE